jgi:hypothetical protein
LTDPQYFAGYWWVLRLKRIADVAVTAELCLDRPPQHILQCLEYAALEDAGVVASATLLQSGLTVHGVVLPKEDVRGWFEGRCTPESVCAGTAAEMSGLHEIAVVFTDLR